MVDPRVPRTHRPDNVKDPLRETTWSRSGLRGRVREFTVARLWEADAVLVLDERTFLKKGQVGRGAARYARVTGQTDDCQVAVFLAYVTPFGRR
ncbi:transposase [Streptomyces sp. NPDC049910]|uniref:transposase n=1 Tax=Streptomyces sp. NPDC049910 TaxID=3155278 RepID=UPI0034221BA5